MLRKLFKYSYLFSWVLPGFVCKQLVSVNAAGKNVLLTINPISTVSLGVCRAGLSRISELLVLGGEEAVRGQSGRKVFRRWG